ncbi:MAG TPA: 30S ribosomal protein S17 [Candidatus Thermoplasmatota archaeon]
MAAKATGGREIGVGVPTPAQRCDDRHCPFHGSLPVRGAVFDGTVVKSAMTRTVVVRRDLVRRDRKFERLRRVSHKYAVHAPPCVGAKVGDVVRVAETRPLSKTVSFVVVAVTKAAPVEVPLTLPTAKPEDVPVELSARPVKEKRRRERESKEERGA